MSQTHQSKSVKQILTTILMLTIDSMRSQPPAVVVLECLLERIKDRNAKAREEFVNIVTAAVLRFGGEKFDSLRKVLLLVVPLLCDIKRNVRHAALECIVALFTTMRKYDRNASALLDQLEKVADLHEMAESMPLLREVIRHRLRRNVMPRLNDDMSIEYGVKIPSTSSMFVGSDELDIEWIVSASSSSSASSARPHLHQQQLSANNNNNNNNNNNKTNDPVSLTRMLSLNDSNISNGGGGGGGGGGGATRGNANAAISTGSFRRLSGSKRMPWDEFNEQIYTTNTGLNQAIPKVIGSREVAPLKAFPLNNEPNSDAHSTSNVNGNDLATIMHWRLTLYVAF